MNITWQCKILKFNKLKFLLHLIHHPIKEVVLLYHALNRFIYLATINRMHGQVAI